MALTTENNIGITKIPKNCKSKYILSITKKKDDMLVTMKNLGIQNGKLIISKIEDKEKDFNIISQVR